MLTSTRNVPGALAGTADTSASAGVQGISLPSDPVAGRSSKKQSLTPQVGAGDWSDTGIVADYGDQITFQASGSMMLGDGHVVDPCGDARTWTDLLRQFPLNSANRGALIGRAGNAKGYEGISDWGTIHGHRTHQRAPVPARKS
ncbi:MAG: hypothetical protein ACP5E5_09650 [Acidobacteriaceae bacterium]